MAEHNPFDLEVQQAAEQVRSELAREAECEEGRHEAHPLWGWRCEHCLCLLCTTCGEEVDRCQCRRRR